MSRHRAHRLWRLAGLQLPRRRPVVAWRPLDHGRCRRPWPITSGRTTSYSMPVPTGKSSNVSRSSTSSPASAWPSTSPAASVRSRVIEVLARLISERGAPRYLRSDNGPEFVSKAILEWLDSANIETALIDPGQAMAERY